VGFWSWFTLITSIIGVLAFMMAIAPFIAMYWGRPKIKIEFDLVQVDGRMVLECLLTNKPTSWFLYHIFGVERKMADDVWAGFTIKDDVTNKVIASPVLVPLTREGCKPAAHISLPSSLLPIARFLIALQKDDGKGVLVADENNLQKLPPGQYCTNVVILVSGKSQEATRKFVVHESGMMHWLDK
jgi:hypothetical protein